MTNSRGPVTTRQGGTRVVRIVVAHRVLSRDCHAAARTDVTGAP
ncbi:MAG: hypothetical protein JWL83_395, partial [Actinomycetia bacterium]|nr:hypothetical protein [Actinomycetes bacterium]